MNIEYEAEIVKANGLEGIIMDSSMGAISVPDQPFTHYSTFSKFVQILDDNEKGRVLRTRKISRRLGLSGDPVKPGSKADRRLDRALTEFSGYNQWAGVVLGRIFAVTREVGDLVGLPEKELIASGIQSHNLNRGLNYGNNSGKIGIERVTIDNQAYIIPVYVPKSPRHSAVYVPKHQLVQAPV